jgi:hypothetical protein
MPTQFKTYDATAIREDLSDVIYDISPTDTPFLSSIAGKGSVANTYFEWQTDALAAASGTNYHVEGAAAGTAATTATTRLGNYTQISKKVVEVTGTHETVNNAGKKSEMAHQLAKASKELKRDMETSLLADNAAAAGNATTARETRGAANWITTNVTDAGTSGTNAAVVEDDIIAVAEATWNAGGEPSTMLLGATNKKLVTAMSGRADAVRSVSDENMSIYNAVDVYVSDFGTFNITLDRYCDQDVIYFLDHDMWSVDYLRDFQTVDIAKEGDSDKKMLLVEYGLRCGNEAANGKIRYTTG